MVVRERDLIWRPDHVENRQIGGSMQNLNRPPFRRPQLTKERCWIGDGACNDLLHRLSGPIREGVTKIGDKLVAVEHGYSLAPQQPGPSLRNSPGTPTVQINA